MSKTHVAFGDSAGGSLRQAVRLVNADDEVVAFSDCLSFGPIDYPDSHARGAWAKSELDLAGYDRVVEHSALFWKKVLHADTRLVLWVSRRSAMEYTGFLECLWRLGAAPVSVVDVTDMNIQCHARRTDRIYFALSVSVLPAHDIVENDLFNCSKPLTEEQRRHYHGVWRRLREENAPFRVVDANGISSAPITYFDELIRSCVSTEWRKCARVIGEMLTKEWESGLVQVGDGVLFGRLQKMVQQGIFESQGDMTQMRFSEVRLRTS